MIIIWLSIKRNSMKNLKHTQLRWKFQLFIKLFDTNKNKRLKMGCLIKKSKPALTLIDHLVTIQALLILPPGIDST